MFSDHLVINGGDHMYRGKPLFRAGIMNSGTAVPVQEVTHPKPQAIYDTAVKTAKCDRASDTLTCLRGLSYSNLLKALSSVPSLIGYTSVDLAYLPRPDPKNRFFSLSPEQSGLAGQFAKVPLIIGDQEDEGTMFALFQNNLTTTADVVNYLKPYFPSATQETLEGVVATYPDDAAAGSPFGTGASGNWYPQFKRLAAILGDLTFTLTRRAVLAAAADKVPVWSYLATYFHGTPIMGTAHGTDLLKLFFQVGQDFPRQATWTYYISFINNLDPNTITAPQTALKWPQWKNDTRQLASFNEKDTTIIKDDFRSNTYDFILQKIEQFRV
jgi:carboxylesterase type B